MVTIEHLRSISLADQQRITDISIKILSEAGFKFDPKYDSDFFALEDEYLKTGGCIIVAKDLDQIIGCVMVKKITTGTAEIRRLRLLPEYRGKGTGKKLLQAAIIFCKEAGFTRTTLDTTKKNHVALSIFLDSGFTQIKQEKQSIFLEMIL